MLVGYVSDERYMALPDVMLEFQRGAESVAVVRSTPRGAVYADIPPGPYRVTLARAGYGSKHVEIEAQPGRPHQFRLLSDGLLGYAWPKWVKSGEIGEYRIHAVEQVRVSLWRYGLKKEFVRLLGWVDEHGPRAVMQMTPDGDYTQTGVEWNRHGYDMATYHAQRTTAPERSGLYYFHLNTDSGAFYSFPWVVAPAAPQAPIAVLASTNTWNAYNSFGGRSHYISATGLQSEPIVNARLDLLRYQGSRGRREWSNPDDAYVPLSFDRPEPYNHVPEEAEITDPIRGRQPCHLAPTEWRLLGWMEREGYGYDIYSDHQLHTGELDLDAYKVLVASVHPEYWSRAMYEKVKDWVFRRGGRLMYLGGNGLNCEVEFTDGATMRVKGLDKGGIASGEGGEPTNFESRMHRVLESEANLVGVVFTGSGAMTGAPYRVVDASHWTFAGTGVQNGDIFGEASLHERCPGGASGHETDKRSPSSPANMLLLAKGLNRDDGGAEIVYHEPGGGGAVFSVGSITWAASILLDDVVSRMTANVIERFLK